jgi:hypothetical protein
MGAGAAGAFHCDCKARTFGLQLLTPEPYVYIYSTKIRNECDYYLCAVLQGGCRGDAEAVGLLSSIC